MKRTASMRWAGLILPLVSANVTVAAGDVQTSPAPIDLSGPWMSTLGPVILKQAGHPYWLFYRRQSKGQRRVYTGQDNPSRSVECCTWHNNGRGNRFNEKNFRVQISHSAKPIGRQCHPDTFE
jgi:hypothetical protein